MFIQKIDSLTEFFSFVVRHVRVWTQILGILRLEYEYKIEYEYDFPKLAPMLSIYTLHINVLPI